MKKIIVDIVGPSHINYGLGNQLFQVASTLSYAKDHGFTAHFPCLRDPWYGQYTKNVFRKLNIDPLDEQVFVYTEPSFYFSQIPVKGESMLISNSYLQSPKYFEANRQHILDTLDLGADEEEYLKDKYESILSGESCSLHIRRGDYLNAKEYHTCLWDTDYYKKSLAEASSDTVLVFSDDPEWAKHQFPQDKFVIVTEEDYLELFLMSYCKNNIIANSTFSWWGAWLNKRKDKKVISPSNWFGDAANISSKDLIPPTWTVL
jgi:hypothetical protein